MFSSPSILPHCHSPSHSFTSFSSFSPQSSFSSPLPPTKSPPQNTEVSGDSDRQTGDQGEDAEESDNIVIIVVAICLIVIVLGLSALFGLHYKRMLPQGFYK